jgi:hypothetical protein
LASMGRSAGRLSFLLFWRPSALPVDHRAPLDCRQPVIVWVTFDKATSQEHANIGTDKAFARSLVIFLHLCDEF